jgi:hypothetical protein
MGGFPTDVHITERWALLLVESIFKTAAPAAWQRSLIDHNSVEDLT